MLNQAVKELDNKANNNQLTIFLANLIIFGLPLSFPDEENVSDRIDLIGQILQ